MGTPQEAHCDIITTGQIYIQDDPDNNVIQKLDALDSFPVFIIQKKAAVDCFGSSVTHEIMDHRKNVILRASNPKSLFSGKAKVAKIAVRNLRNMTLFWVVVESTNNLDATETEATVYVHHKKQKTRIAHVEKYGGTYSPPSYEVFNADMKTAFTLDLRGTAAPTSSLMEYDISTKKGTVGTIMMKTGLNFVLSTDPSVQVIEKATLLGVILAMDVLKTGTRKEATGNQYTFH